MLLLLLLLHPGINGIMVALNVNVKTLVETLVEVDHNMQVIHIVMMKITMKGAIMMVEIAVQMKIQTNFGISNVKNVNVKNHQQPLQQQLLRLQQLLLLQKRLALRIRRIKSSVKRIRKKDAKRTKSYKKSVLLPAKYANLQKNAKIRKVTAKK